MKAYLYLIFIVVLTLFVNCNPGSNNNLAQQNQVNKKGTVISLTDQLFKEKVFNYEVNKVWRYEGNKPCILDFYADWCRPCRYISPVFEEIADKYAGKILVYRINTDKEALLSMKLGVENLPTIIYVPLKGDPKVLIGAYSKKEYMKFAEDILKR